MDEHNLFLHMKEEWVSVPEMSYLHCYFCKWLVDQNSVTMADSSIELLAPLEWAIETGDRHTVARIA